MTTDPMLGSGIPLSVNRFTGDGTTTVWEINFAGGYISKDHVKAFYETAFEDFVVVTLSWIGPNTVEITPAVPSGLQLTIWRDTPKEGPVVDFLDGAIINEPTLDQLAKQSVFAAAEMVDRFNDVALTAEAAKELAEDTADLVNGAISGDFTKFAKTDTSNTWLVAQNLPAASKVAGVNIATTADLASLATTAAMTAGDAAAQAAAIAAAAVDATNKANAAQAAAISQATKALTHAVNCLNPRAKWLYTLAAR